MKKKLNKKNLCEIKDFSIFVEKVKFKDQKLIIYGLVDKLFEKYNFCFFNKDDNKFDVTFFDNKIDPSKKLFVIELDLMQDQYYYPVLIFYEKVIKVKIKFTINANLNNDFASLYLRNNKYLVKYSKINNRFDVYKNCFVNVFVFELKCIYFLIKKHQIKNLLIRELANFILLFKSREFWLISDSKNYAGDNGEDFFRYVIENQLNPDAKYYFAVDKKSLDYKRLNVEYSNVIDINSFRYKMLFLVADNIISSYFDDIIVNPYSKNKYYFSDLFKQKFIYLQNRNKKDDNFLNISLITDLIIAKDDKDFNKISINYLFGNVKTTGFPDNLVKSKCIYDEINKLV